MKQLEKKQLWTVMVVVELTSVSLIGTGCDACNRRGIIEKCDLGTQDCMYGVKYMRYMSLLVDIMLNELTELS